MDIHRRALGYVALLGRSGEIAGVDFDLLVQRLLFLDCFVLKTTRFKDLGYIVRAIGADRTVQFLNSGLIELCCDVFQPAAVANERFRALPQPRFELIWIDNHQSFDKYIDDCLSALKQDLGLWGHEWHPLEAAIRGKVRRLDLSTKQEVATAFCTSLERYQSVLVETTRAAARHRRIPFILPHFRLEVSRHNDLTTVNTDLRYTRLEPQEIHEIVQDGLFAAAALEVTLGQMKAYEAIGGFTEEEMPAFEKRLSSPAASVLPVNEKAFGKVRKVVGLPHFDVLSPNFTVEKVEQIRESDELRVFRDWLSTAEGLTDKEIRHVLRGVRARLSIIARNGSATLLRMFVEAAIGHYVKQDAVGLGFSALDYFIFEQILRPNAPAAFINRVYPSLFQRFAGASRSASLVSQTFPVRVEELTVQQVIPNSKR